MQSVEASLFQFEAVQRSGARDVPDPQHPHLRVWSTSTHKSPLSSAKHLTAAQLIQNHTWWNNWWRHSGAWVFVCFHFSFILSQKEGLRFKSTWGQGPEPFLTGTGTGLKVKILVCSSSVTVIKRSLKIETWRPPILCGFYLLWWTCPVQMEPRPGTELMLLLRGSRRMWHRPGPHCPTVGSHYGGWTL